MKTETNTTWMPAFGFQDWIHQSFLIPLETRVEISAEAKTPVACTKWARGELPLTDNPNGNGASGTLTFTNPSAQLHVTVKCAAGNKGKPTSFEATGEGLEAPVKGVIYKLIGWAFPDTDGKVESIRGAIQATQGLDAMPGIEPGGKPVGTVGHFIIKGK